ncbi:hypothetical protein V462_14005 [Pantoea ananatis 15320]|nr:hypothetical protein L585_00345 [Pantoea ananatis BRT175]PKC34346.1 hypothetical protein V462_14005 [Pantoea ananatis 15320]CRH29759.1 Uncharacterized protein {ECO:0000313/EMBL:ERM12715.1} [Pantoea ananatis]
MDSACGFITFNIVIARHEQNFTQDTVFFNRLLENLFRWNLRRS